MKSDRFLDFAIRYGFLLLLVVLILYFSVAASGFASPRSAAFILQSVAITGILALGVTCTLVVDGFDLSIGSVATSALMLSAYAMVILELSAFTAVVLCIGMGALVGLINGLLIVKFRVPDLLATLGKRRRNFFSSLLMVGTAPFRSLFRKVSPSTGCYLFVNRHCHLGVSRFYTARQADVRHRFK